MTVGSAVKLQNTYDGFGRRAMKKAGTTTTQFTYDPDGHLLAERDTTGSTTTRLDTVYVGDMPLADIDPDAGSIFFLHTDRLGTPQVATTTQAAVAWRGAYDPFGTVTAPKGLLTQNLRFPGQYADATTGWNQNGFRDYNPALGRYLESDPIGLSGGINTYAYVGSNPVNRSDLGGLLWVYYQSTGELAHFSDSTGQQDQSYNGNYSGQNSGLNNPANQSVPGCPGCNGGPLPQGDYTIGDMQASHGSLGRNVIPLTPDPNNQMYGRSSFYMHGDNSGHNNSASEGCVVTPPAVRRAVDSSPDQNLLVTSSRSD